MLAATLSAVKKRQPSSMERRTASWRESRSLIASSLFLAARFVSFAVRRTVSIKHLSVAEGKIANPSAVYLKSYPFSLLSTIQTSGWGPIHDPQPGGVEISRWWVYMVSQRFRLFGGANLIVFSRNKLNVAMSRFDTQHKMARGFVEPAECGVAVGV